MASKEISKWADDFMFKAEEIDVEKGPEVFLISANSDPLGSIAAAAKAYKGEFVEGLWQITDAERRYYLGEVQKSILEMPLEAVNFHFRFKGVTRGFTHQIVRQRTAAYSQESTRFAVKETVPVGLPPSLVGSDPDGYKFEYQEYMNTVNNWKEDTEQSAHDYAHKYTSQQDRWRHKWDELMAQIEVTYNELVNDGMPAEDARGALPTNLLTQMNYFTNLRGLKGHSGMRLCTQAQREWKDVWAQIIRAIQIYGQSQRYQRPVGDTTEWASAEWQFSELANIFRPVCFYTGKCEFGADFDRKCNIRSKVEAYRQNDVSSKEWETGRADLGIPPILPQEWTRADAAR